ncbi:uncharacterized protein LOC127100429 isoform X4 [Lathyrus oleraceus]|uniref:uncharacterized protein LOC127100429 isoform X4 n=1 Tax=Pisum sativum TaxID=3888 RepID=UPI0021CF1CF0|nr:uncharacterized protein LOC127100429 isoform X4 [Pisum sativum]
MPSKESKITGIPGPKSNVSANATTTRSGMLSSGSSKRNQNAHPSLPKNPTPSIPSLSKNPTPSIPRMSKNPTPSISSLSKNPTYVPSIPKVDMADKCSVSRSLTKQAGKLSDTPVSILRPPSRMDQTTHQTGTIKSSGLRKPSPSIGFFSQVKASGSHSLQKSSIPCKPSESNIPKLRKLGTVSVKEARSKIVKGAAKNRTKELSHSDVNSEAIVPIDNKQKAGVEVDFDSSSFEIISKQAEVENILDDVILKSKEQGELHENEIISSMENMVLPTHEKEFLTKSQTHEQLEKDADHTLEKMSDTNELSLSDVKPEAIVQIDNKQMAGVEVDCDSSIFEIISKQAEVENILDDVILKSKEQGELHENEIISSMENMVLPTREKEFLTKSQTHEQLEKEADHTLEKVSDTKELSLSDVKPEAIMQIDNKQMAGVEVDCDSSVFEIISKQAEVENILDDVILKSKEQGELHENEIISSMENMVLPTHEKEFLTKSQTHEQLEKEADHTLEKVSDTKELSLSDVKPEAIVQIDNKQMAGVEVDCDSSVFEIISKQAEVENILDDVILKSKEQGELHENEIISSMENMVLPTHEKEFLTKSQTHEQLEKEADHTLEKVSDTKELSLSDVKPEAIVQIDNKQMPGVEGDCDSSIFEIISKQAEVENILDDVILKSKEQGELHENEIISSMENMVIPTHENELLKKSQTHEQLEKEADHTLDNKLYDVTSNGDRSSYQEPQSTLFPIMQRTSNTVQNTIGQDEDDQIKGPTGDIPPFKESLILQAEFSGEFKGYKSAKTALLNSSLDDFCKTVPEGSKQGTPCKNTEQVNCGADEFGRYEGDAQGHLLNESLIINCKKTTQSNLDAVSQQLQADQPKALNPSGVEEIGPEKENISDMNSSQPVHVTSLFSKGSPENSILGINDASEDESKIIEIKDCQLPVDDQLGFILRSPVDKECDQVIDSKAIRDRTPEFELDRLSENCITVSASSLADDNNINEDSYLPGFQKSSAVVAVNSQDVHLDSDFLPKVIVSSTEIKEQNLVEDAFEGCGFHSNEHNATNHHIEDMSVNIEGNHDVDGKVELLQINDVDEKAEFLQINDVDEKMELLQINDVEDGNHDVDEKVELLQINDVEDGNHVVLQIKDVDEKVELLQINDVEDENHDVDEKVELLQINGAEDGNRDVDEKVELLQINDVDEMVELLQINDVDEKVELLQLNDVEDGNHDVDEKVELLQINGAEDGNRDVDEKVELLQINGAEDKNRDVDEKVELLQINNVDEKVELLQINDVEDGNHDVDEKVELLRINGAEDGNCDLDENVDLLQINDVDEKVEHLQINDVDEKVEILQINDVEDGNHDVDGKVELLQIIGAEDGNRDLDEKVELLQINDVDEKVELLQINDVDEKVEILQINDVEDGNHDVDKKVELLQINGAEDGNRDVDEKVELLQINDVDEKVELLQINDVDKTVELLQINDVEDGNHDVDEKAELLQINGAEDGNHDVDEKVELLQINGAEDGNHDVDEKVELLQINDVEDGNHDVDEKVELLQINGAEDGNHDVEDKVELLQINDAEEGLSDILPLVETQLNMNFFSSEFDSSIEVSEDPFSTAVSLICEKQCSLSENSKLLSSDMLVNKDGNQGVDEKVELLQINGAEEGSLDISPSVEIQLENVISAEFDSSTKVSEDPCLLSEKSKLLASENSIFNATIPQGSEVSSMKLNENAISAELGSSIDVSEGPCLLSEKSKLLASENSIFNATIPEGSEVSSVKLNRNAISADLDSSIQVSEGPFTSAVAWKSEEQCLLSEKSKLLDSDNSIFIETILQGNEVGSVNSESLSDAAVTTVFENDKSPNTDMASQSKDKIDFPEEDNGKIIHLEIDATKTKQEVPIAKPPLNVAPFTEEWLAAIEAAGEEILMMKSGAVQNSPPDKVQNEPNPWSPVKKNQEIGPFDCTKITKHNIQSSDPS